MYQHISSVPFFVIQTQTQGYQNADKTHNKHS